MAYHINSRAYLARAKSRLSEDTFEALFYAAFELRCCVESRQEEYATELEFLRKKIKPWNIGKTAQTLEHVFESNKIAHITLSSQGSKVFDLYHTPVPRVLYTKAEKLGALLHRLSAFKWDTDIFWTTTRSNLEKIYRDAWIACQGTLLTPPLMRQPLKVENPSTDLTEWISRAAKEKLAFKMTVDYLDSPPADWTCDL